MRPLIKIHGGKAYIKNWLLPFFPAQYENMCYVEPYLGAGSILLNKKPSHTEIVNDLNYPLICLWREVRDQHKRLLANLAERPYQRNTFEITKIIMEGTETNGDTWDQETYAMTEYILSRMSRGGLKKDFAWSDRMRGGQYGDVNAWQTSLKQIPKISARIQKVTFSSEDATKLVSNFLCDRDTFIYLDPPYLHETRVAKKAYGKFEMTPEQHAELLDTILLVCGKVMISGYNSELYNTKLKDWRKEEKGFKSSSGQTKKKKDKTEVIWMNY